MRLGLVVIGHFANGQKRMADLCWEGGPAKTQNPTGGEFLPAFKQRASQYGRTFKAELEEAPKRADGLPTFDYISISYGITHMNGQSNVGHLYLAITSKGMEKLIKLNKGNLINFDDTNVRHRFMWTDTGLMRANCSAIVDMTKYHNMNAFWSKVRLYANYLYQPVFAVRH